MSGLLRGLLKLLLACILTPLTFVTGCAVIDALIQVPWIGVPILVAALCVFAVWASPTTRMTSDQFILYNEAKSLLRK